MKSLKFDKERILRPGLGHGYQNITLYKNGKKKTYDIHRLVAQAFIRNPYNLTYVNHKDENKMNNNVNNLEWCTQKYNINYSIAKSVLCVETGIVYKSLTEASEKNKIDLGLLSRVCGKRNSAGGYHWKYINNKII